MLGSKQHKRDCWNNIEISTSLNPWHTIFVHSIDLICAHYFTWVCLDASVIESGYLLKHYVKYVKRYETGLPDEPWQVKQCLCTSSRTFPWPANIRIWLLRLYIYIIDIYSNIMYQNKQTKLSLLIPEKIVLIERHVPVTCSLTVALRCYH